MNEKEAHVAEKTLIHVYSFAFQFLAFLAISLFRTIFAFMYPETEPFNASFSAEFFTMLIILLACRGVDTVRASKLDAIFGVFFY